MSVILDELAEEEEKAPTTAAFEIRMILDRGSTKSPSKGRFAVRASRKFVLWTH